MQLVFAVCGTVLAWAVVLGTLYITRYIPRPLFIIFHYVLNIAVFTYLTVTLRRIGVGYTAWVFAIVVMSTLLALELFYWVFVNPEAASRYLTVADWLIPAALTMIVVYTVARLMK